MKLDKKQYKNLIMMLYCGEWVINAHKTNEDKLKKETEDLEQFIFSFAKEHGFQNLIEYDDDLKMYFPTADMEDMFHGFIDKYDKKIKE